jgi:hypothetical protein
MQPDPAQTPPRLQTRQRVTVQEAARLLDTTVEGVRSRIKRRTLVKEKGEDGTVYVLLEADQAGPGDGHASPGGDQTSARTSDWAATESRTNELIAELRAQNEHLRSELSIRNEELRRKDTIIMTMAQRIPELEAPSEARESPLRPSEQEEKGTVDEEGKRSWWRRMFGG